MVPVAECKTADDVKALAMRVRELRLASTGFAMKPPQLKFNNLQQVPYMPPIPFSVLVRKAYPEHYPKEYEAANIEKIKRAICLYWGLSHEDLLSSRRNHDAARPRQIAMALAVKFTKLSLPQIGRHFSRDHTTVLHARNKLKPRINSLVADLGDAPLEEWITALSRSVMDDPYFKQEKNGQTAQEAKTSEAS